MDTLDRSTIGGDFFTRISTFLSSADPLVLVAALICTIVVFLLGVIGARRWLLLLLLLTFVLSGSIWAGVDAAATMLRWLILALIAANVVRLKTLPGWGWICFGAYVAVGVVCVVFGSDLVFSLQVSVVLVTITLAAASLSGYATDAEKMASLCSLFIVASIAWVAIGLANISSILEYQIWHQRFGGGTVSANVFSATGAVFLPFAVWGALRRWSWFRRAICAALAASILLCLVASATRGPTLAGIIGCLPLLFLRNFRATLAGGAVLGAGAAVTFLVLSMNTQYMEKITKRYTEEGLNAREVIWTIAIGKCLENPVLGAGHGASEKMVPLAGGSRAFTLHGPHNAFLAAWYNAGIFGMLLLMAAVSISLWKGYSITRSGASDEVRQLGALLFGVFLAVVALSMVRDGLARPSTISTVVAALMIALIGRLSLFSQSQPTPMQYWLVPVQYRPTLST